MLLNHVINHRNVLEAQAIICQFHHVGEVFGMPAPWVPIVEGLHLQEVPPLGDLTLMMYGAPLGHHPLLVGGGPAVFPFGGLPNGPPNGGLPNGPTNEVPPNNFVEGDPMLDDIWDSSGDELDVVD
ncbi:hypothetical protein A2U01_0028652, partial [Trifolium medium]|nr:hypothetical protein [Trifolium medium]